MMHINKPTVYFGITPQKTEHRQVFHTSPSPETLTDGVLFGDNNSPESDWQTLDANNPLNIKALTLLQHWDIKQFNELSLQLQQQRKLLNLSKNSFAWAKLNKANLSYANFSGANLTGTHLREANLERANLEKAKLRGAYLTKANLSYANLSSADLKNASLFDANLSGANLSKADLSVANLSYANLSGANLTGTHLREANLERASLEKAELSKAVLTKANLSKADLSSTNLKSAYLSDANLSGANLTEADLSIANLSNAKLSGANLTGATFLAGNLFHADLSQANLTNTTLSEANLNLADLSNSILKNTKFEKSKLSGANLSGTNLSGAKIFLAELSKANLSNTNLTNANLSGTNLDGANLTNATLIGANFTNVHLEETNLTGAKLDFKNTLLALLYNNNVSQSATFKKWASPVVLEALSKNPTLSNDEILDLWIPDLLPHWLSDTSKRTLDLINTWGDGIDGFGGIAGWYDKGENPLEAELFLLLRHPKADQLVETLGLAITAPYKFSSKKIEKRHLNETVVNNWRDIGLLAHDFKRWKYDTQKLETTLEGGQSLFEHYGFTAIENRTSDATYGKGFVLQPLTSPDTLIEFRRGYLLISHPDGGTLVIRNSSKKFGRNLMPHAAYFSTRSTFKNELMNLDPANDERFKHIMDERLYLDTAVRDEMRLLLNELMAVRDDYRRWKFDVDANDNDGNSQAYLSPGYQATLDLAIEKGISQELDAMLNPDTAKAPALAFMDTEYPTYSPLAEYPLTGENLTQLVAYRNNELPPEALADLPFIQFLQAGLNQQKAELVLT